MGKVYRKRNIVKPTDWRNGKMIILDFFAIQVEEYRFMVQV
jgi:hypothetical protein